MFPREFTGRSGIAANPQTRQVAPGFAPALPVPNLPGLLGRRRRDVEQPAARFARRPLPLGARQVYRRVRPDSSLGSIRMSVTNGPRNWSPSEKLAESPMPICVACPWLAAR